MLFETAAGLGDDQAASVGGLEGPISVIHLCLDAAPHADPGVEQPGCCRMSPRRSRAWESPLDRDQGRWARSVGLCASNIGGGSQSALVSAHGGTPWPPQILRWR